MIRDEAPPGVSVSETNMVIGLLKIRERNEIKLGTRDGKAAFLMFNFGEQEAAKSKSYF